MSPLKMLYIAVLDIISWTVHLLIVAAAGIPAALSVWYLYPMVDPPWFIIFLPLLYLVWVFSFLFISAAEMTIIGLFHKKVPRLDLMPDIESVFTYTVNCHIYTRVNMVWSLPWLDTLIMPPVMFPWIKNLVMRAYSSRTHVGINYSVFAWPMDPDLTFIGDNTVIGFGTSLIAHGVNTRVDGSSYFVTAPINVGDNVTIGGNSRIAMGVTIGNGAIVEVGSNVLPYTRIGPGEVWGGNPAVLIRMLNRDISESKAEISSGGAGIDYGQIRHIIARTLGLDPAEVTEDLNDENCADWDSLSKMSIAASLYDTYGIRLRVEDIPALCSLESIQKLVEKYLEEKKSENHGGAVSPYNDGNKKISKSDTIPDDPELLPLLDYEYATKLLAADSGAHGKEVARQVVIASSFTANPLGSAMRLWCGAFDIPVDISFADYGQVEQMLLSPGSGFFSNSSGYNAVILRPEDLISENDPSGMEKAGAIINAVKSFNSQKKGLIISNLPPAVSPNFSGNDGAVMKLRTWWRDELEKIDGVYLLDFSKAVEETGLGNSFDAGFEVMTRAPYSQKLFQRLGIESARLIRSIEIPPKKVICLDCDNTIWGGVIGEDGRDGIRLGTDGPGRAFRLFQEKVLDFKKQGLLLTLVSKNEESDVWDVFENHPDMALKKTDISGFRINWLAKSENIKSLARELNLGVDSFVFFDDSPQEQLEVRMDCPGVTVIPMPSDAAQYPGVLSRLWCFDSVLSTGEDLIRGQFMDKEKERKGLQEQSADISEYLKNLDIRVTIGNAAQPDLPRVAQLTQKTNQFNLSLTRRSLEEINEIHERENDHILVLNAADRFGDYGLVGLAIVKVEDTLLTIDTFLMSCRALGRNIEDILLNRIFDLGRDRGIRKINAPYTKGPRNNQVSDFFTRSCFTLDGGIFSRDIPEHTAPHENIKVTVK